MPPWPSTTGAPPTDARATTTTPYRTTTQAIRLRPDYALTFYYRGAAYGRKGDYDRAIQDLDQAIRLKPDDALAFNDRGATYVNKGDYERAIQDFDQAIRLKPDYHLAFNNRGAAYRRTGDYDRAIQDLDQAIRLKPDDASAFLSRGLDRFFLAQFTGAQEDLTVALRNDRTDQYSANSAIWLYLARGRNGQDGSGELAKNTATLKLATWPGPVINFYLGKITSSALLQAANDADPRKDKQQHCEVNFYLGEDGLLRGQQEDAIRYFRDTLTTGVTACYVYEGAKAELKRMQVAHAADRQRY